VTILQPDVAPGRPWPHLAPSHQWLTAWPWPAAGWPWLWLVGGPCSCLTVGG